MLKARSTRRAQACCALSFALLPAHSPYIRARGGAFIVTTYTKELHLTRRGVPDSRPDRLSHVLRASPPTEFFFPVRKLAGAAEKSPLACDHTQCGIDTVRPRMDA